MSMNDFEYVKQAILTWTYNTLNSEYPLFFNKNDYTNTQGVLVKNSPNVYWQNTVANRPLDATQCVLTVVRDRSYTFGSDGKFYQDETDNKYYYEVSEPHDLTVRFAISSMKNETLNITALQAQNLAYNSCSYLRMLLKSGSASDYFTYDNEIKTPILVGSQSKNISEILNISDFEDTKDKFTYQFSCIFRYDFNSKREVGRGMGVYGSIVSNDVVELAQDFDIHLNTES